MVSGCPSAPISAFVVTDYIEGEAIAVTELARRCASAGRAGEVWPRPGLWPRLDRLRVGAGVVPVRPELVAGVRYFGRYRTSWIRDGVLLSVG
jgi:hypothetical protein